MIDAAAQRGREYFNVPALFLRATGEALDARAKAMAELASPQLWKEVEGEGAAAVAARLRGVAALCAREEAPDTAAKLLILAVGYEPVSEVHARHVRRACALGMQHRPSAERRALEALSMLLESGGPEWTLTFVALATLGGNRDSSMNLALAHGRPYDIAERQIFDEDATSEARKGSALLHAAAAGDTEAVAAALAAGADATAHAVHGVTPLMLASRAAALAAVQALLVAKADATTRSRRLHGARPRSHGWVCRVRASIARGKRGRR